MNQFDIITLDADRLAKLVRAYAKDGYVVVDGLLDSVTAAFPPVLAEAMQISPTELERILDPSAPGEVFPEDMRRRVAKVATSPELAKSLLAALSPVIHGLLGQIVHVSSTFHAQFKGGGVTVAAADHGRYASEHMEMFRPYLVHQDFTGANIPTSPSAMTLWVGLNRCPDWNLCVYPGTHRHGLLCQRWLDPGDQRVSEFASPLHIAAEPGRAVLFNALLLHATSNAGPLRRVSCDIRFFPLCGFLPSDPWLVGRQRTLPHAAESAPDETLQAPRFEADALLRGNPPGEVERHSILNWANYIAALVQGDQAAAVAHLKRFVEPRLSGETAQVYIERFHGRPLEHQMLASVESRLGAVAQGGDDERLLLTEASKQFVASAE